jgi:hypothetical protein
MLDDLREQASETDFFIDEEENDAFSYTEAERTKSRPKLFLGMTPAQRFIISVMILVMTCVLSVFFLLVAEKIVLPFF